MAQEAAAHATRSSRGAAATSSRTDWAASTDETGGETARAIASSSGRRARRSATARSSVRSSLIGVIEIQPCSSAQRSVPSSEHSTGLMVNQ